MPEQNEEKERQLVLCEKKSGLNLSKKNKRNRRKRLLKVPKNKIINYGKKKR